jgi:arabinan endo-1,5-alpha-L-arabinosidase
VAQTSESAIIMTTDLEVGATKKMRGTRRILRLLVAAAMLCAAACHSGVHDVAPDPAIIAAPNGGGYYVFGTGDGLPFWHSNDLINWKLAGHVFATPEPTWSHQYVSNPAGCWAPDISLHNGLYYLYYAVSQFGTQDSVIGLAVNKTLDPASSDYKWEDRGLVIASAPGKTAFNAIDPALFVDRDRRWYLFFGSFFSGIQVTWLDSRSGKLLSGNDPILTVAARPGHLVPSIEGAYVIERGNYYYLFVSWGMCCFGPLSTYKVMVGRAGTIRGPYLDHSGRAMTDGGGTLVLESSGRWRGPGHNSVLTTAQGQWLVYHTYDLHNLGTIHSLYWSGRRLQLRPLTWTKDGWPIIGAPLPMHEE